MPLPALAWFRVSTYLYQAAWTCMSALTSNYRPGCDTCDRYFRVPSGSVDVHVGPLIRLQHPIDPIFFDFPCILTPNTTPLAIGTWVSVWSP